MDDGRLSQMSTAWTLLFQARDGADEAVKAARRAMLQRYGGAVYRYLRAAAGDPDAADDLYQEFALRVVRGDYRRADPDRGRFRDFLKTSLYHLIVDHQRARHRRPAALAGEGPAADESSVADPTGEAFVAAWRAQLLTRAWEGLAADPGLHAVLRLRTDQPDLSSEELAARLSAGRDRPVDAGWVRKRLHQARARFADLLVAEVRQTLDAGGPDELADELREVGLLDYCRGALGRAG
jgi:RNA polymerase sigma-70 factor (ECF subfamily)